MNLSAVMDAIGNALDLVPNLRVFPYFADSVTPPAATVGFPDEYLFDETFGRGSDRATIPVNVVVGKADARSARDQLAQYANGSGPTSVKQAVEQYATTAWDSVRVKSIEFGVVSIASVSYLAATFNIEIIGRGA